MNDMKLWSKGFEPDKLIEEFTVGNDRELDLRLARYDVEGSMAHIRMLESIGLLEAAELEVLLEVGIAEIQGYFLSRPQPMPDLLKLLQPN
jgi:argininosuccinate lyase